MVHAAKQKARLHCIASGTSPHQGLQLLTALAAAQMALQLWISLVP